MDTFAAGVGRAFTAAQDLYDVGGIIRELADVHRRVTDPANEEERRCGAELEAAGMFLISLSKTFAGVAHSGRALLEIANTAPSHRGGAESGTPPTESLDPAAGDIPEGGALRVFSSRADAVAGPFGLAAELTRVRARFDQTVDTARTAVQTLFPNGSDSALDWDDGLELSLRSVDVVLAWAEEVYRRMS
ncbi:hypothetical protein P0W64_20810 [Tsukamurella sp. 8F]|uniref:hypothetical protein n=1 Tax=unclassified Tsukamurella TaxID=2633480 RepID=UPI0023B8A981|nr:MULTISPECIES: hypothetical protein [unclassified Tsukamurella]MDF0532096.1 hypothetical protein [Tsukamurella sp. 8J]MDF0589226.1 hypothetical protein [Tsukamurella sp. 8F]